MPKNTLKKHNFSNIKNMKKINLKIFAPKLMLIFLTFSLILNGCENKKNTLKNTEWKLINIVDTISNTSKVPEPNRDNNFIVKFQEKGLCSGYSSINAIEGEYYADYKLNTIKILIKISNFANDSPDGYTFLQYMEKVNKFLLTGNKLKLYYNNQICLEFKRR
ncbi:hypothetical protein HW49_08045 [Porphyromonadaceae bacterium COT-184 OH4590]|nr:hypothetical protein HW49_08045 [Porphyromonadaceae bacterium COT-184 OH4590]